MPRYWTICSYHRHSYIRYKLYLDGFRTVSRLLFRNILISGVLITTSNYLDFTGKLEDLTQT